MVNMFPTWQIAQFTTAVDTLGPEGWEPAGLIATEDNGQAAFPGGDYKWDGANQTFNLDPRWWVNRGIYQSEFGMNEARALSAPSHSIMCLLDYVPAHANDIYYVAIYFRVNTDGRFFDDLQPTIWTNDNWGGTTTYSGDPATWTSMPIRINVFSVADTYTALSVPWDPGGGLYPKSFSNLLDTATVTFDPANDPIGGNVGTEGYRLAVGSFPTPGAPVAASAVNLAIQLVPDAEDFHPNFEIIGVQLNEVLLGQDHNGNKPEFWQDFYKSLELPN